MKRPLPRLLSNLIALAGLACVASLNAAVPAAITDAVPESGDYELIYEIALPDVGPGWANSVPYDVDNSATGPEFDRVAYVMELDDEWVWVSFTAITNALDEIGIPTSGVHETPVQQFLEEMNVFSNIADASRIQSGEGLAGGNIEFWGGNYAPPNAHDVPNASGDTFDFGDNLVGGGHGCMQVHNHEASQVLFAYNNWGTNNPGSPGGLGIGSDVDGANPDWTFAGNSNFYDKRNLYVLVRAGTAPVIGAPSLIGATASLDGTQIALEFDEPLAASSTTLSNFSIAGLDVTAAALSGTDTVILTTALQTGGNTYSVSYVGISDLQGLATTDAEIEEVTTPTTPSILADIPGAEGFDLIYQVAIPDVASWNGVNVPYSVNESHFRSDTFDRVAYIVELDGDWVFASFDAVLDDLSAIGVPTVNAVDQPVQTRVNNLDVDSNIDLVTKGTGLAGGNIEFWPGNYSPPNVKTIPIPNADEGSFDFGDNAGGGAGYGSMQVHNHIARETVFAYNAWGAGGGDLGIGNGGDNPDWTFAGNAASYGTRNLYVLARSGPTPDLTVENPTALNSVPSSDLARVFVEFDQPMDETTALDPANYTIDGISVTEVTFVDATQDSVILTTSEMAPATDYTVAISTAIQEKAPGTQAVMAGSTVTYTTLEPLPGFLGSVPETSGMTLAYRLEITEAATYGATGVPYSVNESVFGAQGFDRVGYAMSLDDEWVFVSFDAPKTDITKIGVPAGAVGVTQQNVSNLSVVTNVGDDRITQGIFLEGNVEFWGTNYGTANANEVPNADSAIYDFGDQVVGEGTYGSMQVHNYETREVLFAFNRWNANDALDIGIGSDTDGGHPDWTFTQGAGSFEKRELFIFVGKGEDPNLTVRPTFDSGVLQADSGVQSLSIPVRNTGGETALGLSSVVLNQTGSAYTLVSSPDSIPPGETGNIEVTLDPSTVQGLGTAELVVTSNDPSDPVFTIGLSASVPISAELVAWYSIDDLSGCVLDSSGNGRHASISGAVSLGQAGLASGTSAQFTTDADTGAAYVSVPNMPALQTLSVSLWAQATGEFPSGIGTLFGKLTEDAESPYGLSVFTGLDNTLGWLADEDENVLALDIPNSPLTESTHVVLVHEDANGTDPGATVTRIYINGVEASAKEGSLGFTDSEGTLQIGARLGESGFFGLIDEVQVYSIPLTADDVTQLFENPGTAVGVVPLDPGGDTPDLLVLGADDTGETGADANVLAFLEETFGPVRYMNSGATDGSETADVIIFSSTFGSGSVRGKFHNSSVPIVNWEEAVMDAGDGEFGQSVVTMTKSTDTVQIALSNHPIAGALAETTIDFFTSAGPESLGSSELSAGTDAVGTAVDGGIADLAMIFATDVGGAVPASAGITDNVSPARRVAFPITDNSFNDLTDAGKQLFVNSILWAAGRLESGASRADLGQVAGSKGALTAPALVDFGDLSGDATYEFSFHAIKVGASTAIAGNATWGLKLDQWNEQGVFGTTEFGVADNLFTAVGGNSVASIFDQDMHVVIVNDSTTGESRLFVNGTLVGTAGDFTLAGEVSVMAAQPGFIDPMGEGSTMYGWATYNTALSADDVEALSSTPFPMGSGSDRLPALESVGITGNGVFGITLPNGVTADIEYSTDLENWEVIAPGVSGALEETDADRIAAPTGFYRAKQ